MKTVWTKKITKSQSLSYVADESQRADYCEGDLTGLGVSEWLLATGHWEMSGEMVTDEFSEMFQDCYFEEVLEAARAE